jgi:hypothetical protein
MNHSYWVFFPLILGVIAVIIAIAVNYTHRQRRNVFREIKRNKMHIQTMAEVLVANKKFFNNDIVKTFEHSKGFLIKSIKDMKDVNYIARRHTFKDDDECLILENAYKAFAVISDILSFLDKINTEKEIKLFMTSFHTAGNLALQMANKALVLEENKK